MARLLILTPAELTRDPRARRAANAAVAADWDVTGICPAAGEPAPLGGIAVIRVAGDRFSARLRAVGFGGGRPDSTPLRELRGIFRLVRLVRLTFDLVRGARAIGRVDVVHANDFDTLPAAWLLARRNGARLVYDAHEIYIEQELDPPRIFRVAVGFLERLLANRAAAVVTVNEAIAEELAVRLRIRELPLVVHNWPLRVEMDGSSSTGGKPLRAIYQGALGHGRQLDDLLAAAGAVGPGVSFHLRLVGIAAHDVRRSVADRALETRVTVLEPVPADQLVEALFPFDVGLVVTRPLTLNDRLATPNKLFEYLMAGLAVVVPKSSEAARLVEAEDVGTTFAPADPSDLARVLDELSADHDRVENLRRRARRAALERFNAEAEWPVLAVAWGTI